TCRNHKGGACAVAFSPDGRSLLTGSAQGEIHFSRAQTGHLFRRLRGHSSFMHSIQFARAGAWMLTSNGDRSLKVWETTPVRLVHDLKGHTNQVCGVAVAPDGKHAVSGSGHPTL